MPRTEPHKLTEGEGQRIECQGGRFPDRCDNQAKVVDYVYFEVSNKRGLAFYSFRKRRKEVSADAHGNPTSCTDRGGTVPVREGGRLATSKCTRLRAAVSTGHTLRLIGLRCRRYALALAVIQARGALGRFTAHEIFGHVDLGGRGARLQAERPQHGQHPGQMRACARSVIDALVHAPLLTVWIE